MHKKAEFKLNDVTKVASRAAIAHAYRTTGVVYMFDSATAEWRSKPTDEIGLCRMELELLAVGQEDSSLKYAAELRRDAHGWHLTSLRRLTMVNLDAKSITYRHEAGREAYASEHAAFCAAINDGAQFALTSYPGEEDRDSFIVLRDGSTLHIEAFLQAAGLPIQNEGLEEVLTLFGSQFIGFSRDGKIREMRIVSVKGTKAEVLATVGEEKISPRGNMPWFEGDRSESQKIIRDYLLYEADGVYILAAEYMPALESALKLAESLRSLLCKEREFPRTITEVRESITAHLDTLGKGEQFMPQRDLLLWGLDLVAHRHLGRWVFDDPGFYTEFHSFKAEYYRYEAWPVETAEFLAFCRAYKNPQDLYVTYERIWPNKQGSDSLHAFIRQDPKTGLTFCTRAHIPTGTAKISGEVSLWKKHFGADFQWEKGADQDLRQMRADALNGGMRERHQYDDAASAVSSAGTSPHPRTYIFSPFSEEEDE